MTNKNEVTIPLLVEEKIKDYYENFRNQAMIEKQLSTELQQKEDEHNRVQRELWNKIIWGIIGLCFLLVITVTSFTVAALLHKNYYDNCIKTDGHIIDVGVTNETGYLLGRQVINKYVTVTYNYTADEMRYIKSYDKSFINVYWSKDSTDDYDDFIDTHKIGDSFPIVYWKPRPSYSSLTNCPSSESMTGVLFYIIGSATLLSFVFILIKNSNLWTLYQYRRDKFRDDMLIKRQKCVFF